MARLIVPHSPCRIRSPPPFLAENAALYKTRIQVGNRSSSDVGDTGWCGLCGDGGGWCSCGRCNGEGGFATKPGLAGVKGKVGWARCKTCFGKSVVPCLLCGISQVSEWKLRLKQQARGKNEGMHSDRAIQSLSKRWDVAMLRTSYVQLSS